LRLTNCLTPNRFAFDCGGSMAAKSGRIYREAHCKQRRGDVYALSATVTFTEPAIGPNTAKSSLAALSETGVESSKID